MAEILLVNPRRRRRKTKARRANPKRRRAVAHKRRRRRNPVAMLNPRRRRRRNPAARSVITRRFRRRRNPSLRGLSAGVMPTLKAGAIGAAGAIGLDVLWGQGSKYLPASIAGSPLAQYAAKLAGAILVGIVGGKVLRGRGRDLAVGAATVVLHDAAKAQLQASMPSLPLGEYLTYAPSVGTMNRAGRLLSTGMGEYLSGIPNTGAGGTDDDMAYTGDWNGDGMNG